MIGRIWIVAIFAVSMFVISGAPAAQSQSSGSRVLVEQVLNNVQRALIIVQDQAEETSLPKLSSVTVKLSTQIISVGKGKVEFFVISLGGGASAETAQTLTLKLVPPKPGTPSPVATSDIAQSLAGAIVSAARGVKKAMTDKPPLTLVELTANIKFVVKKEGGGGVSFNILPLSIELGGDVKNVEIQEITVTFK